VNNFILTFRDFIKEAKASNKKILLVGNMTRSLQRKFENNPRFVFWDDNKKNVGRIKKIPDDVGFIIFTRFIGHKTSIKIEKVATPDVKIYKYTQGTGMIRLLLSLVQ